MQQNSMQSESLEYYRNPVLPGDWPDPSVLREGDCYYLITSTARYYPSLTIWRSSDLVDWVPVCHPVPRFAQDVWAPNLSRIDNWYYLYYSAGGTNYVTRSHQIDGGWCEPVDLGIGRIDPGFCEENGAKYLMMSGGWLVPLADDGVSVSGEAIQVFTAQTLPDDWDIEGSYPEAPKILHRGNYYYLVYADGGTGGPATAHAVMAARSKSLFGPWEYSPYNPVVHTWSRSEKWYAKGHGHLIEDAHGQWWILYHAYQRGYMNLGRSLLLEEIEWTSDGWFRLRSLESATRQMIRPKGDHLGKQWSLSDDFSGPSLNPLWKQFGGNVPQKLHLGKKSLLMEAQGQTPGNSIPLVISATDCSYVVSSILSRPRGCEAGLILIYDELHFAAAGWDGSRITLYRLGAPLVSFPIVGEQLQLFLRNEQNQVAFYYSMDGKPIKKINYVIAVQSMNASAYGGFSSLRPGIFAAGNGEAEFINFCYSFSHPLLGGEQGDFS